MSADESVAIVLEAFRAVEQRDERPLQQLYHRAVEFQPTFSSPHGGSWRGDGFSVGRSDHDELTRQRFSACDGPVRIPVEEEQ
jgi:hypothetical protein